MTEQPNLSGTWDIDQDHSRIGFSTRHAMVTKIRGAFNEVSGTAVIDGENTEKTTVTVTIPMASVDTRNAQRDAHLLGPDFFDVEKYPTMEFVSTKIDEIDDNSFIVAGDLTIHGITRSISIPLSLIGVQKDSFGITRAGFEGSRRIDRKDWGVSWNTPLDSGGLMVSDKINLEFELSLVLRTEEPEAVQASEAKNAQ